MIVGGPNQSIEINDVAALVISIIFVILMAGLGFILLYRW